MAGPGLPGETPPTFSDPVQLKGQEGPAQVELADIATLQIPAGLFYYDPKGAAAILSRGGNPVPKMVVGMLVPPGRGWQAVIEFKNVGRIPDQNLSGFQPEEMLKKMLANLDHQNSLVPEGTTGMRNLEWEYKPIYRVDQHLLEWALRASNDSVTNINYNVCLLGREGALLITWISRANSGSVPISAIKELAQLVTFKEGHRYWDFKDGDPIATCTLADLIVADNTKDAAVAAGPASTSQDMQARGFDALWVSLGVIALLGCFVAAGGTIAYRRIKARQAAPPANKEVPVSPEQEVKVSEPVPATTPARRPLVADHRLKPALASLKAKTNGEANGARRRAFDYNRYFSDLLSNVYSQSYAADHNGGDGLAFDTSRVPLGASSPNGSANGHSDNGSTDVQQELILSQQSLIEEQRRLIQEQSKIIEEKTRLIAEKNNILKLQSQLLEHKLL